MGKGINKPKIREVEIIWEKGKLRLSLKTKDKTLDPFLITDNREEAAQAYLAKCKSHGLKIDFKVIGIINNQK